MQPRDHHYVFGHVVLRNMFLSDPERFLGALQKDGQSFLEHVWGRIAQDIPPGKALSSTGLGFDLQLAPDSILAIIRLPPAKAMAEAMLVGCHLVRRPPEKRSSVPHPARYFTLELGFRHDESPRTVLCEWNSEGQHLNFGDGPPAESGPFAAAIRDKVKGGALH